MPLDGYDTAGSSSTTIMNRHFNVVQRVREIMMITRSHFTNKYPWMLFVDHSRGTMLYSAARYDIDNDANPGMIKQEKG
jgi:hypothetical protein